MMKYIATLTLVCIALIGTAQFKAQIGVKGGLNLASINADDPLASYESTTGFHIGAYALAKVAMIGIQPEVLYSVRGTAGEFDLAGVKSDFSQDFVYLDIPIMVKFYLPLGLHLQAGPQFGTLISVDGEIPDGSGGTTKISKDSYKDSDVSAALGAGWDAPFGLSFSARYVIGLSDVNDGVGVEAKNRTFQLSVGYKLFGK
ncbi:MAG: PorT family protein [Cyclobacteriaceae bacterium]